MSIPMLSAAQQRGCRHLRTKFEVDHITLSANIHQEEK
jgi:hypothetical protein